MCGKPQAILYYRSLTANQGQAEKKKFLSFIAGLLKKKKKCKVRKVVTFFFKRNYYNFY